MQGVAGETHVPNTKEGANVRVEGHLRPSCDFREGLKVGGSSPRNSCLQSVRGMPGTASVCSNSDV